MIKKAVKFQNADGVSVVKDFYFNIPKLELIQSVDFFEELKTDLGECFKRQDLLGLIPLIDRLIAKAHNVRIDDDIVKDEIQTKIFMRSEAHSVMVLSMLENFNEVNEFLVGLFPSDMAETLKADLNKTELSVPPGEVVPLEKKFEDYTQDQLLTMSGDEFHKLVGSDPVQMSKSQLQIAFQRRALHK